MAYDPTDLGAWVVDIGSGTTKVGSAGGDIPGFVVPTLVTAAAAGAGALGARRRIYDASRTSSSSVAVRSPLQDGLIEDWEGAEALLEYAGDRLLSNTAGAGAGAGASSSSSSSTAGLDLSRTPVILSEHLYASKADREKWAQLLFEKHRCAGLFVAKAGVLALYANARVTGIAVDMGAGGTQITPVQEGYALMMGARIHPVGGRALDEQLAEAIEARAGAGYALKSRAELLGQPSSLSPSLAAFHRLEAAREAKEGGALRLSDESLPPHVPGEAAMGGTGGTFELPDGSSVTLGDAASGIPELLFQPTRPIAPGGHQPSFGGPAQNLADTLVGSAMACDPELRRDLVGSLVLTGGASRLPGLQDRLVKEFGPVAPVGTRARWAFASPEERTYGAWVGGSILGSLGTFPDMFFSAAEYKEHGAKMIHRKCP